MYLIYSAVYTVFVLVGLPVFLFRSLGSGRYTASIRERLGFLPASLRFQGRPTIWIHAVSVGEVVAARTLLPLLREAFPENPIVVSVTTLSGRQVAERQLKEADGIFYCPYDWRFAVKRVVDRLRPRLVLLIETEIWPQLLRTCHRSGASTVIVNGRISDRSYPRYRSIRPFLRRFLREVDCFCMQSPLYAERIIELGAPAEHVKVTGSLKYDAAPVQGAPASEAARLLPRSRTVLIAGSTLAPEEDILIDTFLKLKQRHPDLYLVLAPRHPERFAEVTELCSSRGLQVVRRSRIEAAPSTADTMVLDTLGELASLYAAADVVFVGGSIAPWGGHNVIEPAAFGKAIVFGPHMSNFREIASTFVEEDAAVQIEGREALPAILDRLVSDREWRESLGAKARELVEANRGAGRKTIAMAREALKGAA